MATFNVIRGSIIESKAIALVNPVNCVGVSGAGLALLFKELFPMNELSYRKACKRKELTIGRIHITEMDLVPTRYIVNFPTKVHWKDDSRLLYIKRGVKTLAEWMAVNNITSVALPKLGCGKGNLCWEDVEIEIRNGLHELNVRVELYV